MTSTIIKTLRGWKWYPVCQNPNCGFVMAMEELDDDRALKVGTQCPRCLVVLNMSMLAQAINDHYGFEYNDNMAWPRKRREIPA